MNYVLNQPEIIFLFFTLLSFLSIIILQRGSALQISPYSSKKNFCQNHLEKRSASLCHICNAPFCDECIKTHSTLTFCQDHFKLIEKYQWKSVLSFQISAEENYEGLALQKFKEMIWVNEGIPSYIVVEYRINFEEDLIESHMSYFTRIQDQDLIMKRFRTYKEVS